MNNTNIYLFIVDIVGVNHLRVV